MDLRGNIAFRHGRVIGPRETLAACCLTIAACNCIKVGWKSALRGHGSNTSLALLVLEVLDVFMNVAGIELARAVLLATTVFVELLDCVTVDLMKKKKTPYSESYY